MKPSQELIETLHKKILKEKKKNQILAHKVYMMLDHSTPKNIIIKESQKQKQLKKQLKVLLDNEIMDLGDMLSNFHI